MTSTTLIWDIEASDLKADWGRLLCVGYKWQGAAKTTVRSIWEPALKGCNVIDDEPLLRAFWPILCSAKAHVTYFGSGYDLPFLQAKALRYRITEVPQGRHIDLYRYAKPHLLLRSRRLANVMTFLRTKAAKSPVLGETWQLAEAGDTKSARYIIDHCRADVVGLEETYHLMAPVVHRWGPCAACGSLLRVSNGIRPFKGRPSRRIWCQACGVWERRVM